MPKHTLYAKSDEETMKAAEKLASFFHAGDVIALEGDLGAGKTTFTKGFAKGLGIRRTVNSPTFTIVKEYAGSLPLYHIDAYRLEDSDEDIGFDEYFNGNGVTVVEWAKFIDFFLPQNYLQIEIHFVDEQTREINFHPIGSYYERIVNEMNS